MELNLLYLKKVLKENFDLVICLTKDNHLNKSSIIFLFMSNFDSKEFRDDMYIRMLQRDRKKYYSFLLALKTFRFASMSSVRGSFLENYYFLMRYVDDVVDGDIPLQKEFSTAEEFVSRKIDFLHCMKEPDDNVDFMILYSAELGKKFDEDFSQETEDILNSLLFDAKRRNRREISSAKDLNDHFHLLDIRGTIKASLKVFGEDPEKYEILKPLGLATRIMYNLRDYEEDVNKGLINIPLEDIGRLGINCFESCLSPGVKEWFIEQKYKGLDLLRQHEETYREGNFGLLSRIALKFVFEKPTQKYLEKVF